MSTTDLATEPHEIPYPLMDEDGEHYWLPGHIDPTLMVLSAVVEQMIDVGPHEAMQLLVGGPISRDMTVVSDRPVWAWSYDDQRRRARELVESVEHVWMVEHPDDADRMIPCGPNHPGAQPFTHLGLV